MDATPSIRLNELRPAAQFKHYQLLEQIGSGGQGVVWSALDQTHGRVVAIKFNEIAYTDQLQIDDMVFERQKDKLVSLRHPHILPMYELDLVERVRYQVSSYIPGGSLADGLRAGLYSIQDALRYAAQIAAALDYLHGQGVIHRDLKPGNALLDFSKNVYVADFGLARVVSTTTDALHTGRGTPPYSPPEQHKLAKMTRQSDIYSFGIMLYEIFTGQLPWKGERSLGMQQLYSTDEIPDPYEANPTLPRLLVRVLRQMTAADPNVRPRSAGEAMNMVYYVFGVPPIPIGDSRKVDETTLQDVDAQALLKQGMEFWDPSAGNVGLSLTKFALIELSLRRVEKAAQSPEIQRFMLQNALTFGYHDDFWWNEVPQPSDRLNIAAALMGRNNEFISARVIGHIIRDPELHQLKIPLPARLTETLLELADKAKDVFLREQSLEVLRDLLPPAREWRPTALSLEQDRLLANLALADTAQGDNAALLIGHLRSLGAAQAVLSEASDERRVVALMSIQRTAGSLPVSTPFQVRAGILFEWMFQRLFARPLNLLAAYATAMLGAALGFGSVIFFSYRLPNFMDILRISVSLERGFILGSIFGLGVFLSRLMVERLSNARILLRITSGVVSGAVVMNIAVFVFDVLILKYPPGGLLITAACLLTALGFALGGLSRFRVLKILISGVASFAAMAGSWWIHTIRASSPLEWTPLFVFESNLPMATFLGMVLLAALMVATLGNIVDLTYKEE